jgi:hypothetical protein
MALVSPQVPNITGSAITYSTPTTSETFVPGNNIYYHVKTVGTGITTTVVVPGSQYGQARPDIAITIGTNVDRLIGPLVADLADPTTGLVTITHSVTTAVTAAALAMGNG